MSGGGDGDDCRLSYLILAKANKSAMRNEVKVGQMSGDVQTELIGHETKM